MLEVNDLQFSYGDKQLFNNLTFKIYQGEHVGLVGANGSGKSTLMNLLAHRLIPDSGKIIWEPNITFSYLDQYLQVYDDITIKEYLYNVYQDLFNKEQEMHKLYESMEYISTDQYDKVLRKADNMQMYLEENEFYMIKSKISNIINGLGITIEDDRILKQLSGGQRAKVFLGKMLLEDKDVLLLDEPTNFLDAKHVEWLAKFLSTYKNAFIVISHNQSFLNQICNNIIALENRIITKYKGNYDDYLRQRTMNLETYNKEYVKQQKFIKQTEEFINKNIARATTTKRAQSRRKMLEKITVLEKPQTQKKVSFNFEFTKSFNLPVCTVRNLEIGYQYPILPKLNLEFEFGKKYVIIGKNGVGKTTFLKTILGIIKPISGTVKLSPLNDIVYFSQEIDIDDITPIQFFRNEYPHLDDGKIRALLAKYGVTGELPLKTLDQLSGGELAKVRFAKLSLESSNFLMLDEPTNHLDKIALQALFKALASYPGTVILVSHDKEFYRKLDMIEIRF